MTRVLADCSTARIAMATSCAVGFLLGATRMATWQTAVESAQVLAGTVQYDSGNSFYQYHVGAWTLSHQILALPLYFGISEAVLSILLSGFLGGLSFLALSLTAYAVCRRPYYAVLAPLFVMGVYLGHEQHGPIYPIHLMGTHHTYGVLGRGGCLLLLAAYALGYRRIALFGAPVLLALHPTWGAWTILLLAVLVALDVWRKEMQLRRVLAPLVLGGGVTTLSLVTHLVVRNGIPSVDAAAVHDVFEAFIAHWDYHRRPVMPGAGGLKVAAALIVLLLALLRFKSKDSAYTRLCAVLLLSTGCALVGAVMTWIPEYLPEILNRIMPGRFVNLSILAMPAVLVGAAGAHPNPLRCRIATGILLAYLAINIVHRVFLSSDKYGWSLPEVFALLALSVVVVGVLYAPLPATLDRKPRQIHPVFPVFSLAVLAALISMLVSAPQPFSPWTDREIWDTAREGEGLLITSGNQHTIQVRTRRPLLLNVGALDQIVQVPASGPAAARDLEAVYGINLFDPPEDIRAGRPGSLLPESSRDVFESRTREEWADIARRYGATQVLTDAAWTLDLAVAEGNETWTLYTLPAP